VAEEKAIAQLAGQLGGPYALLLARAAGPAAASPPRDLPAGCTPPRPPLQGVFRGIGAFGTGPGQFDRPTDVAIGPGGVVYVADQNNSRVDRFSRDGNFLGSFGSRPNGDDPPADGQFIEPVGVATDGSGNVYVTDFRADRVQKFTADGQFITKWGGTGTADGQFTRVGGVAVGPSGSVYVVDPGGERVQKFDSNGVFLAKFGTTGTGPGQFEAPRGITVAPNGDVYVAERDNGRVQVYDANGTYLREWGHRGLEDGAFNGCYDVAIDPSGNVWVADLFGYRIEKFTPTGDFLGLVEEWGPNRESFNPFAVAVDSDYNVWVTDIAGGTGDRVLMFGNQR
jgi:sugar lactone lactonase YvrE